MNSCRWARMGPQVGRGGARLSNAVLVAVAAVLLAVFSGAVAAPEAQAAPAKAKKGKAADKGLTPAKDPDPEPAPPAAPPPPVVVAAPAKPARPPVLLRAHSINASPQGAVFGDYIVNYQWMFRPGHALVGEVVVTWSGDESDLSQALGGQIGYRYLSNGTQNSWLFGVMAGYDVGVSKLSVTATSGPEGSVTRHFSLPYSRWRITGNVGRRWVFGPGLNVTARFGVGPGKRTYVHGGSAEADHQAAVVENIVNLLPISLDSEVSLGWLF